MSASIQDSDVIESKRLGLSLPEKASEPEHVKRMKAEFLANASHEMRTPLNAIIGFAEALKEGMMGEISDTQREYIGEIGNSGRHLLSLITDILDLSKLEAGVMELQLEPVDLKSLLSNSLATAMEKAAAQHIVFEHEIGEDLGLVGLDTLKTRQIVHNLLSNAVNFCADGGRVSLRARRVGRSTVGTLPGAWPVHSFPLAGNEHSEFVEISVTVAGSGLSPENMAKLFQAFSHIDSGPARKFEATGLGLAVVRQLAELHGGGVAVASAEGVGTRFAAWLPLRAPTEAPAVVAHHAGAAIKAAPGTGERIALVVDDDDQAAELLRLLLEAEGFRVLRSVSAEDALELAPRQSLALITLDLNLYGINGWQFLQAIRKIRSLAHVPVVIISGQPVSKLAITRGASAVLQKPISRALLRASLANLGLLADASTPARP